MFTRAIAPGDLGPWAAAAFLAVGTLAAFGLAGLGFYHAMLATLFSVSMVGLCVAGICSSPRLLLWSALGVAVFVLFAIVSPALAAETTVTIPVADWLNPVLEFLAAIGVGLATWLVGVLVGFLPAWLRPLINTAVQAALAGWIRQAINYAIQQVEGFDQNKTISFQVGSSGLAAALRFLIEHGPTWLLKLAGGPDKLKAQVLAALSDHGIVLDANVPPQAVAAATNPKSLAGDDLLKKVFTGK